MYRITMLSFMTCVLFLLVILILCECNSLLLVRKCCSERQQLNKNYTTCIDYNETFHNMKQEKQRTVADMITEDDLDFPWWMDSEIKPISPRTLKTVQSFFRRLNESKYIEFGDGVSCELSKTLIMDSRSPNLSLLLNGSLILHAEKQVNKTFDPTSYCADRVEGGGHVYVLCSCLETVCVRKCCPNNNKLAFTNIKIRFFEMCKPTFHISSKTDQNNLSIITENVTLLHNNLTCQNELLIIKIVPSESVFWQYSNSTVPDLKTLQYSFDPPSEYCWDSVVHKDNGTKVIQRTCAKRIKGRAISFDRVFIASLCIISLIFFVFSLIILVLLPIRRKYTWIIVCDIICQMIVFLFLTIYKLYPSLPHELCITYVFIVQFFFLASLFWLNVMCIDISWTFSGIRSPHGSPTVQARKKFLYYSLYAWGGPTIITMVTIVMEIVESIPDSFIKPDLGIYGCWFKHYNGGLAYLYGPSAALTVANIALFVYTIVKILLTQRSIRNLHSGNRSLQAGGDFKKDKQRFVVYAKLFSMMGVTWIFEVMSFIVGGEPVYWYVPDAVNYLRGMFVFVILCSTREVRTALKQRMSGLSLRPGVEKSDASTQQSSLQSLDMDDGEDNKRESNTLELKTDFQTVVKREEFI